MTAEEIALAVVLGLGAVLVGLFALAERWERRAVRERSHGHAPEAPRQAKHSAAGIGGQGDTTRLGAYERYQARAGRFTGPAARPEPAGGEDEYRLPPWPGDR